jgi:predicted DNA-binding protein
MDEQLSLRLPRELARQLSHRARTAGVKRSAIVREALEAFLGAPPAPESAREVRERLAPFVGAVKLSRGTGAGAGAGAGERDALLRQLRAHNWRE